MTEEGFEQAADKGLEKLAKENDFYKYVLLHWIGLIYLRSEYYSKPKVEKRIYLVCKTENEIISFSIIMEDKIKSALLIDHEYFSNNSQSKLIEQELFVLKDLDEVRLALNYMDGVVVVDNPTKNEYPMPISSHKKDEVFVGRIRRDFTQEKTLNMWIVADNLRKGAATNTVQIAEYLISNHLV